MSNERIAKSDGRCSSELSQRQWMQHEPHWIEWLTKLNRIVRETIPAAGSEADPTETEGRARRGLKSHGEIQQWLLKQLLDESQECTQSCAIAAVQVLALLPEWVDKLSDDFDTK